LLFLHTDDGGIHWSTQVLPALASVTSYQLVLSPGASETMSCPAALTCLILANPVSSQSAVTWRTTDGGQTWSDRQIPGGAIDLNLSCPTAETCWAGPTAGVGPGGLLKSEDGGTVWTKVALPSFPAISPPQNGGQPNISCSSSNVCYLSLDNSGLVETDDGGRSWHAVPLPSSVGAVLQVSCNGGSCAAVANTVYPSPGSVNPFNGGSLILSNGSGG